MQRKMFKKFYLDKVATFSAKICKSKTQNNFIVDMTCLNTIN